MKSESFFLFDGSAHCVKYAVDKMFEIKHGWSGLLVEGNPLQFALCNMTGRKAWQVHIELICSLREKLSILLSFAKYKDYDQLFIQAPVCLALKDHAHFAQFSAKPTIEV